MAVTTEPLNLQVLIAEDDPVARDILQVFLETLGCRVQIAQDGNQAIRAFRDCADSIDLLVLDAEMPGPDPRELYERLRAISSSVPILICSALSDWDSRLDFVVDRGLMMLMKPFTRSDLRQAIAVVLDERKAGETLR